jgi:hypothetical protein
MSMRFLRHGKQYSSPPKMDLQSTPGMKSFMQAAQVQVVELLAVLAIVAGVSVGESVGVGCMYSCVVGR